MQWLKLNIVICYTLLSCVNLERNIKYQNDIFNGTDYDEYLYTKSEKESVMNFSSKATANGKYSPYMLSFNLSIRHVLPLLCRYFLSFTHLCRNY